MPSSSLEFLIGKVTIGITTRNRWTELETTIHQLIRHGLQAVKVIIIDDGSSEAMAHNVCEGLKNCWILREEHSLGLVVERNRIAALCDTEYLISLDDDACFVNIDGLEHSVRMCDEDLSIAVIAFSVATADTREEKWADADRRAPYDVAGFMGGGHMLRVATFRQLEGYRDYLYFMCEERDFALRVFSSGQRIVLWPAIRVLHRVAPGDRWSRMGAFYFARNTILIWFLNAPKPALIGRLSRAILGLVYLSLRKRIDLAGTVAGIVSGLAELVLHSTHRAPMSANAYKRWMTVLSADHTDIAG
ncbi:MAG: glycosyltransferase family 2 protein [Terracidiphilus sp.]